MEKWIRNRGSKETTQGGMLALGTERLKDAAPNHRSWCSLLQLTLSFTAMATAQSHSNGIRLSSQESCIFTLGWRTWNFFPKDRPQHTLCVAPKRVPLLLRLGRACGRTFSKPFPWFETKTKHKYGGNWWLPAWECTILSQNGYQQSLCNLSLDIFQQALDLGLHLHKRQLSRCRLSSCPLKNELGFHRNIYTETSQDAVWEPIRLESEGSRPHLPKTKNPDVVIYSPDASCWGDWCSEALADLTEASKKLQSHEASIEGDIHLILSDSMHWEFRKWSEDDSRGTEKDTGRKGHVHYQVCALETPCRPTKEWIQCWMTLPYICVYLWDIPSPRLQGLVTLDLYINTKDGPLSRPIFISYTKNLL